MRELPNELYIETIDEMINEEYEKLKRYEVKAKVIKKEMIKARVERLTVQEGIEAERSYQKTISEKEKALLEIEEESAEIKTKIKLYENFKLQF